jgi:hypothetical protein
MRTLPQQEGHDSPRRGARRQSATISTSACRTNRAWAPHSARLSAAGRLVHRSGREASARGCAVRAPRQASDIGRASLSRRFGPCVVSPHGRPVRNAALLSHLPWAPSSPALVGMTERADVRVAEQVGDLREGHAAIAEVLLRELSMRRCTAMTEASGRGHPRPDPRPGPWRCRRSARRALEAFLSHRTSVWWAACG